MKKTYITADQLLEDSFTLAADIIDSGYRPTLIIGVWRGGAPIAIAVHELFEWCGLPCDHIAVKCTSYSGIDERQEQVEIADLHYLQGALSIHDRVLIVDDVHDSGHSVAAISDAVSAIEQPESIKTACAYFNPGHNQVTFEPDYFVHKSNTWLVFPHELQGLSEQELAREKPGLGSLRQWLAQRATHLN